MNALSECVGSTYHGYVLRFALPSPLPPCLPPLPQRSLINIPGRGPTPASTTPRQRGTLHPPHNPSLPPSLPPSLSASTRMWSNDCVGRTRRSCISYTTTAVPMQPCPGRTPSSSPSLSTFLWLPPRYVLLPSLPPSLPHQSLPPSLPPSLPHPSLIPSLPPFLLPSLPQARDQDLAHGSVIPTPLSSVSTFSEVSSPVDLLSNISTTPKR